jgi:hypothetical protein
VKPRVYIETSVLSYLTSWRSRDLVRAHVAIATVHGMNFLLTWNCAHIANAVMRESIESVCRRAGYRPPVICTPEELTLQEDT